MKRKRGGKTGVECLFRLPRIDKLVEESLPFPFAHSSCWLIRGKVREEGRVGGPRKRMGIKLTERDEHLRLRRRRQIGNLARGCQGERI